MFTIIAIRNQDWPGSQYRRNHHVQDPSTTYCLYCRPFRPLRVCALGWLRPGYFVPPLVSGPVWLRRRGLLCLVRRCRPLCRVLVAPLAGCVPRLCCPCGRGLRWAGSCLVCVCSHCPAARACRSRSRLSAAGGCCRRPGGSALPLQRLLMASSPSLLPAAAAPAVVGFSGGRRLSPAFRPVVAGAVSAVLAAGRSVAVGCAPGADSFVRAVAPGAVVFSASSFGVGRSSFARRSVALVRAVAAGGPGSGLVVFPGAPCPAGLSPSASSLACFCGLGSGSWASAAFAVGLGLPVVVFPCGFSALPPWGAWVPAGAGLWASGWRLGG